MPSSGYVRALSAESTRAGGRVRGPATLARGLPKVGRRPLPVRLRGIASWATLWFRPNGLEIERNSFPFLFQFKFKFKLQKFISLCSKL
jgi:hypothetical protein